jgi:thiol-disulfide isomerase/thioredoxin
LFIRKKFFYLAIICFIFLFLAVNYERSDSTLKQMEQEVVAAATKTGVYQGDIAENFQLITTSGERIKLSEFRGKKVIVNFFATWCGPCQEEMPLLVELDKRTSKEQMIILGVNVTREEPNPTQVRDFLKQFQVQFEVLFDGDGEVMKTYQLIGIPTTIFIDEKGKIVERLNGMITMEMIESHPFFKGMIN